MDDDEPNELGEWPTVEFDQDADQDQSHPDSRELQLVDEIFRWLIDSYKRERRDSIKYRVIAAAMFMRPGMFASMTVEKIAKKHGLERQHLPFYVKWFHQWFKLRRARRKKISGP
jgi:hypothetical protein